VNLFEQEPSSAALVGRIMFDWSSMSGDALGEALHSLPRKVVRWIGTYHPDNRTRKEVFRLSGVRIGHDAVINMGTVFMDNYEDLISIGDRASIAPNVLFIAEANPNRSDLAGLPEVRERLCRKAPINIADDAWIGAAAIILPGITVGKAAVVGAGSVVTQDVAPFTVVAGMPSRLVRTIGR
jgi:acetyltransferase-like isoleucine patch superfamily enzyme